MVYPSISEPISVHSLSGIGVDLGGSKIATARFSSGVVKERLRTATDGNAGAEHQVNAIVELIQQLNPKPDEKVGVAVAGRVNHKGEWFAVNKSILKGINQFPLKSRLETRLNRQINVVNDCVAGGVAEAKLGAGKGLNSFAYITVSTGVGGICMINDEPVLSANGLAGHIGFMTTREFGTICGSGRNATIESVASGRSMEQISRLHSNTRHSTVEIFQLAAQKEEWAQKIIEASARAIAELCSNLACAIGIERVVLGGSIGLLPAYQQQVRAAILTEPELFHVAIEPALLGQDAVMLGALCDT